MGRKKTTIGLVIFGFLMLVGTLLVNKYATKIAFAAPVEKIKICHASDSHSNPYIANEPNANGDVNGHDGHQGTIWYSGIADHSWGDIIPRFEYCPDDASSYTNTDSTKLCSKNIRGTTYYADPSIYPGKNWNSQGQAIWDSWADTVDSCAIPAQQSTLSCDNINVTPSFGSGNEFAFGQTYNFSATTTGTITNYFWSINQPTPALTSVPGDSTQINWTAPSAANPGMTWILTLTVSDESENEDTCTIEFRDPTSTTTNDVCANIDGVQTSVPSGLHLDASGRNCVDYQYGGPSGGGTPGGSILGASTTSGRVLGTTTVAKTGIAEDIIGSVLVALGSALTVTSFYGYKKAFNFSQKEN